VVKCSDTLRSTASFLECARKSLQSFANKPQPSKSLVGELCFIDLLSLCQFPPLAVHSSRSIVSVASGLHLSVARLSPRLQPVLADNQKRAGLNGLVVSVVGSSPLAPNQAKLHQPRPDKPGRQRFPPLCGGPVARSQ
jgi:hypothetical protein